MHFTFIGEMKVLCSSHKILCNECSSQGFLTVLAISVHARARAANNPISIMLTAIHLLGTWSRLQNSYKTLIGVHEMYVLMHPY